MSPTRRSRRRPGRRLGRRVPGAAAVVLLAGAAAACSVPTVPRGGTTVLHAGSERLAVTVTGYAGHARPARRHKLVYTPPPTDRLVAVAVRLTDRGRGAVVTDPSVDSQLIDAAGQPFHAVDFPTVDGALFAGGKLRVRPRHSVTGVVTFVVPRSATGLRYAFSLADGFRSATARWPLR